jgi:hypothetical protein
MGTTRSQKMYGRNQGSKRKGKGLAATTSHFATVMNGTDYYGAEAKQERRQHRLEQLGKLGAASDVRKVELTPELRARYEDR